jgi:hypothetical protein
MEKKEKRVTLEDLQETHRLIEAGEIVLKCMLTRQEVPEDIKKIWESRGKHE